MAGVTPPQGGQKNYVDKPQQVYGEQYLGGGPIPVGAVAEAGPGYPAEAGPYLVIPPCVFVIQSTDWVITDKHTGRPERVLTDEEFSDRFGGGGGPNAAP